MPLFFSNPLILSNSVTDVTDLAVMRLNDLRLDDARALLEHDPSCQLPEPESSPVVYLQSILDGLCELSLRDPLTGLFNRRHFNHLLDREIESVARRGESVLLLMLDIDHFKLVNDTHGHHAGDRVLQAVARCMQACVRPMDTVSRLGGEEFAIILPNCPATFGPVVAERIREAVANLAITVSPSETLRITISLGGAYAPEWVRSTITLWTERADEQLYRAKAAGRNRVFIEEQCHVAVSAEEKGLLFGHLLNGDPAPANGGGDTSGRTVTDREMNRAN